LIFGPRITSTDSGSFDGLITMESSVTKLSGPFHLRVLAQFSRVSYLSGKSGGHADLRTGQVDTVIHSTRAPGPVPVKGPDGHGVRRRG